MLKVVCINDKNKPSKIPQSEWIVEGNVYTVRAAAALKLGFKIGLLLEEVQLSPESFPYEYYDASRFKPLENEEQEKKEYQESDLSVI